MKTFFCLLVLLAVSTALPYRDDRIVGGQDAADGAYPWQVSLRRLIGNSHFCGGSLISKNYVMSACHCKVDNAKVAMGSNLITTPVATLEIDAFTCNPDYGTPWRYSNDFAVIKLASPAPDAKTIAPVALPYSGQVFTGNAITSGWGYMYNTPNGPNTLPNELQMAEIPLIDDDTCNEAFSNFPNIYVSSRVDETMQCAGGANATSCNGDSGGPLVQQVDGVWTLVGAVSWGSSDCALDMPVAYARIAYARDWIAAMTGL